MALENWQPSTLSWSFSKKTHFDSCKRHYFYHRFWGQDPRMRWRLYEMRNISTLAMLRGDVVHIVIAEALRSLRSGRQTDSAAAKRMVTQVIREKYMESVKKLWHIDNRPPGRKIADITNLLEHYYKLPNTHERAREAQQIAWKCVENLLDSDFWADIAKSNPDDWKEIEENEFHSFDLDGIQVYARIDFAHSDGVPTIIDWKTGSPNEQDRKQLVLYSLYARAKWDWDPLETKLAAVYLQPDLVVDSFSPSQGDIETVSDEVKRSFNDMLKMEPAYGEADIEKFPMTDNTADCYWCRFQGICK